MNIEASIAFIVILASVGVFFLVLPLVVMLASLRRIWREQKGTAVLLAGTVALTSFFFAIFLAGFVALTFGAYR